MSAFYKDMISLVRWNTRDTSDVVTNFLQRPSIEAKADASAREVLDRVRKEGDVAVVHYAQKFDHCELTPDQLPIGMAERRAAQEETDVAFRNAAREAHKRIVDFAKASLRKNWTTPSPRGGFLGEQFTPLDRVGCYVPSGTAPLASTALMTATLARVAGVQQIVACTPAGPDGRVDPFLLYALDVAGATEIYRVGGIHAIAAMAYGTKTIAKVQKIVGPGGPYVTAAKRLVYGDVDLDMIAGPSEIAILADRDANPVHVAADMLSQAEHGTGSEKCLLVTPHMPLAESVRDQLVLQSADLPKRDAARTVLQQGTLIAVTPNLDEGMELCNRFAPEHFELLVNEARNWLRKVERAGAVFIGPWTPECAGDFAAGPSHVLPTGGSAAFFSGLTVDSFRKRTSLISLTRADLNEVLPIIDAFARVEGLEAHGRSARVRFQ